MAGPRPSRPGRWAQAAFVSAGGYHHHLGFNVWRGEGVPPAPPGRVCLRHWTVVLDGPEKVAEVREQVGAAGIATEEREGGFLARPVGDRGRLLSRHAERITSENSVKRKFNFREFVF